jgi:hypothetical protein
MISFPPPYTKILATYEADDPHKTLRVGQWFYNRYMKEQYGPEVDLLYNTTDFDVIFNILLKMYEAYQWPMQ